MKHRLLGALCAGAITFATLPAIAMVVSGQGTWETSLQGRDLDGNAATAEAYYDTVLDITWLADANAAGTRMNWADANTWVAALNINGVSGWRLPTISPINGSTFNTNSTNNATTDIGYADSLGWVDVSNNPVSELGHMYYANLGNLGQCTPDSSNPSGCIQQVGWGISNTGPFSNIQSSGLYWTDTIYFNQVWIFTFYDGQQNTTGPNGPGSKFAWAVHDGDVGVAISSVPVPAAAWLMGSGLIGLFGLAKRKR